MDVVQLPFIVTVIARLTARIRQDARLRGQQGDRRVVVDQLVVQIPVPVRAGIRVRLGREMLVSSDLRAGGSPSETVDTVVQHGPVIQRVAIENTTRVDVVAAGADVFHDVRRRLIHVRGEIGGNVPVGLMLDADCVAISHPHMPRLIRFAHHLGDLPVHGADDVMGGDLRIAVLEPGDGTRVRSLRVVDGHRGDGRPAPTGSIVARGGGIVNRAGIVRAGTGTGPIIRPHLCFVPSEPRIFVPEQPFEIHLSRRPAIGSVIRVTQEPIYHIKEAVHRETVLLPVRNWQLAEIHEDTPILFQRVAKAAVLPLFSGKDAGVGLDGRSWIPQYRIQRIRTMSRQQPRILPEKPLPMEGQPHDGIGTWDFRGIRLQRVHPHVRVKAGILERHRLQHPTRETRILPVSILKPRTYLLILLPQQPFNLTVITFTIPHIRLRRLCIYVPSTKHQEHP